jgi:ESCRT-I complex subunit TSG101
LTFRDGTNKKRIFSVFSDEIQNFFLVPAILLYKYNFLTAFDFLVRVGPGSFSKALLFLGGTIPVQYKGNTYNIPVSIWFPEGYPYEAPLIYVNPTQNMIVTPQHPHVDESGRVRVQYLDQWSDPRQGSNILVMMTVLVQIFSQNPPLRTRPQAPIPGTAVMGSVMGAANPSAVQPPPYLAGSFVSPPSQPQQPPSYPGPGFGYGNPQQGGNMINSMIMSGSNAPRPVSAQQPQQPMAGSYVQSPPQRPMQPLQPQNGMLSSQMFQPQQQPPPPSYGSYNTLAPSTQPQQPPHPHQPSHPQSPTMPVNPVAGLMPPQYPEDPRIVSERNAKINLTSRAQSQLREMQRHMTEEIEKYMLESSNYEDTTKLLEQTKQGVLKDRDQLTGTLGVLSKQSADLARWIEENERPSDNEPSADELTEPSDPLLRQLFSLRAEDAAIEDMQYWLDKALKNGRIDFPTFLKVTRNYASDQFLKRALMKKIQDIVGVKASNAV